MVAPVLVVYLGNSNLLQLGSRSDAQSGLTRPACDRMDSGVNSGVS